MSRYAIYILIIQALHFGNTSFQIVLASEPRKGRTGYWQIYLQKQKEVFVICQRDIQYVKTSSVALNSVCCNACLKRGVL